jgi:hypothetical protein
MSNIHSKQTGSQVHNPKKFDESQSNSVLANIDSNVSYVGGNHSNSMALSARPDSSGNLNNTYFTIWTQYNTKKIAVYHNVNMAETFVLPDGYDAKIEVAIDTNATAIDVAAAIDTAIKAASETNHVTYTETTLDGAGNLELVNTGNIPISDVDSGHSFTNTRTEILSDEVLTANSTTGKLTFKSIEGNTIKSTGETGGTKYLREDGDGSCSWQTIAGADGDITGVSLVSDSGTINQLTGNATFTIEGGTGISTSATGSTLTIEETTEKKSKADIDNLTGVSTNDLGTFTGDTIADETDIKGALQDLETALETDASDSVKGVAQFDSDDFTVSSGEVTLNKRVHYWETRFSVNNLDIEATGVDGTGDNLWLFPETNNNKPLLFNVAVDADDCSFEKALRSSFICPLSGETWKLVGGQCVSSGENTTEYDIAFYNAEMDSGASEVPLVMMGSFNISGTANHIMGHTSLVPTVSPTFDNGHTMMVALKNVSPENTDMDVRGIITLKFEVY